MQKNILFAIASLFLVALVIQSASAYTSWYGYDSGYKNEYYVKDSYNVDGHTFTQRQVTETPDGKKTQYTQVKNYNNYASPYQNQVSNYWAYGPNGYSYTKSYADYSYDDAARYTRYGSSYHPYMYNSDQYYNGRYWDWSGHYHDCINVHCSW